MIKTCEKLGIIASRPYITFMHFSFCDALMLQVHDQMMIDMFMRPLLFLVLWSFYGSMIKKGCSETTWQSSSFWNLNLTLRSPIPYASGGNSSRMECHWILVSSRSVWTCSAIGFSFVSSSPINGCHVSLWSVITNGQLMAVYCSNPLIWELYMNTYMLSYPLSCL